MDDVTAARRIAERLQPPELERGTMRTRVDAEQILRHGLAQIALRKVERLSYAIGDDRASALQFEADLERIRVDKAKLH
jgi:hypothetical protein